MRALLVLALASGCGRIAFDPSSHGDGGTDATDTMLGPDAPPHGSLTHDEDGDGVVDGYDSCPHLVGPQTDSDGDGVGDLCDPQPTSNVERITLFEAFESGAAGKLMLTGGNWQPQADSVRWPGAGFGAVEWTPHATANAVIAAGWDLGALVAGSDHQLTISIDTSGVARTYGEIYQDITGPAYTAITHFDGTAYNVYDQKSFAAITSGRLDQILDVRVSPRSVSEQATWTPGSSYTSTTISAVYPGGLGLGITVHDIQAQLRYVLVIESP